MSLSSETKSQFQAAPFSSALSAVKFKQSERDEIEHLTNAFLRNKANRIVDCHAPGNVMVEPAVKPDFVPPKAAPKRIEPINSPITLVPYKNRALQKSKHGQNIRSNRSGTSFWVQVGAVELGRGEGWSRDMASATRDKYRESCGMPPADY